MRGNRRVLRGVALGLAVWLASGCATYTAVRPGSIEPGQEVRITLDPAAAPQITEFIGTAPGPVLVGTVTGREAEGLMVSVASLVREEGLRSEVFRQRVRIPESAMVGLELRTIDRARTAVLVGLGVAAAVAAVVLIHSGSVGGSVEGDPLPPPQMLPRW